MPGGTEKTIGHFLLNKKRGCKKWKKKEQKSVRVSVE